MKRTLTIFAAAALAAGLMVAQTAATHKNPRMAARQRMEEALNLTDAQKAQAKSIFLNARQEAQPLRAQLKSDREALRVAVKANDTAQIDKLSANEGRVIGKLMAVRHEAMAKFYQSLTPEQRAKADQLHSQMKQNRENWRAHHQRG
jgi:Spy/CpxP family protein refolding chaperone